MYLNVLNVNVFVYIMYAKVLKITVPRCSDSFKKRYDKFPQ